MRVTTELTDAAVRTAKPRERDYKLTDSKGLHLLVRANGSKLWQMRYRFPALRTGKEKVLSFGAYPEVTLAEARSRREAARALLRSNMDPAVEKRRQILAQRISEGHSFEAVAREWHELQRGRWTAVHARDVLDSLEADVFPKLGGRAIADIESWEIIELLRGIENRGAIETAKRVRQRISAVFVLAKAKRLCRDNPAGDDIKAVLKPKPKTMRQPAVTNLDELRRLLTKSEASGAYPLTLLASRLLALTAVRPGVVRGAPWAEILNVTWDEEPAPEALWHIPAERMKLLLDRKDEEAFDFLVPLAPAAVDVLRAARRLSGNCALIFPGQRHAHRPLSENAIGYLYNRVGWHGRHVPHGWRAAFSTVMNERYERAWRASGHTGASPDRAIIDLMLAHIPENKVEGAYNRAQFMDRRREIAEEWAELLLDGLCPAGDLLLYERRQVETRCRRVTSSS